MRNPEKESTRRAKQDKIDPDSDRYPTLAQAFRRVLAESDLGEDPVERLDVHCFANGDVTCRVWPPRAEEPEGTFLSGE